MHANFIAAKKVKQRKIESKIIYSISGKRHRCLCAHANSCQYDISMNREYKFYLSEITRNISTKRGYYCLLIWYYLYDVPDVLYQEFLIVFEGYLKYSIEFICDLTTWFIIDLEKEDNVEDYAEKKFKKIIKLSQFFKKVIWIIILNRSNIFSKHC